MDANEREQYRAAIHGDRDAFEMIYRRYAETLFKYVSEKVFTRKAADSILINGFVALWDSRRSIKSTNLQDHLLLVMRKEIFRYIKNSPDIESYRQFFDQFEGGDIG